MKNCVLVRIVIVYFALVAFADRSPLRGDSITFEFNQDGVLPSAQGAIYTGNVPETSAFSVSGGLLHQDTLSLAFNARAFYVVPGIFNHKFDATLEWSARVLSSNQLGVQMDLANGKFAWNFFLQDGQVVADIANNRVPIVSMNTTDAFHDYKVVIPANSPNFDFFVDGALRFSGMASPGGESILGWGDSTPTGGNGSADWDFVRLTNPETSAVPEPTTLGQVAIGAACLSLIGYAWRGRKREPVK
jgi:hypothetical protein